MKWLKRLLMKLFDVKSFTHKDDIMIHVHDNVWLAPDPYNINKMVKIKMLTWEEHLEEVNERTKTSEAKMA